MRTGLGLWRGACLGALALVMMGSGLVGCGRSELASRCSGDQDCPSGLSCSAGVCIDIIDPQADMSSSDMPGPDMKVPDMEPPKMCVNTSECPGGGGPVEDRGQCLAYVCDGGQCVPGQLMGEPCSPWQQSSGCNCAPIRCEQESQCQGYACDDGVCGPCSNNRDCDSGFCGADGQCQPQQGCRSDEDCPANETCSPQGVCVSRPECVVDPDCDAQEICLNGKCTYSPECQADNDCRAGYECIGDRCFEKLCRGPEDCPDGLLCDAGQCVSSPPQIARCFIASPPEVTVTPRQRVPLDAFAIDAQGNGVAASFVWSSSDAQVVRIEGLEAVARNRAGTASVTATLAGGMPIQCEGEILINNVGPPMPNQLRVLVVDAETGRAVSNADVYVGNTTTRTNSAGLALLPDPGNAAYEVSVFTDDYNYLTVQGVRAKDIRLPLNPATGAGPRAGFKGFFDLSRSSSTGEFSIGLAGQSIAGGLINFDLTSLLGDPFVTSFNIPGQGNIDIPIPGGLVLYGRALGLTIRLKERFYANGAGGARLGWGLGGKVPVSQLIQLFQGGGGPGDLGDVLALLLPLFNRFDHDLKPLNLTEYPRVVDGMDFDKDGDRMELLPDYQRFPDVNLTPSVRQQLLSSINVSNFPQLPGGPGELAVIVGGSLLQAPGFVPLGLTATTDRDGDGRPDPRLLTMAPPYGSLVGGRFAVMAIALRTDDLSPTPQGGLELPDEFSAALWNGQSLPTAIQLGSFPNASTGQITERQRRVTIAASAGPIYRIRFLGEQRSWDVWSPGAAGAMGSFNHTVTVPVVPRGRQDLFNNSAVLLDAIRTQVGIDNLVEPTGVFLHDVALVATGFNRTKLRDF